MKILSTYRCAMKYALQMITNRLDGTKEEKNNELATRAETLYVIAQELRHDGFVSSFSFVVVVDRS
jgi:hypothetical protein